MHPRLAWLRSGLGVALWLCVVMALVAACTGGIDEVTAPVTSPTPTVAPAPTATTVPTATAEPTLIPTVTPTSLPETLQREPAVPLADCAGSVQAELVPGDQLAVVQTASALEFFDLAGGLVGSIPCLEFRGEMWTVAPGWALADTGQPAVASIRARPSGIVSEDLVDDTGILRNPQIGFGGVASSDSSLYVPGSHDAVVLDGSTEVVTPIRRDLFRLDVTHFDVARDNRVVAMATDSGAWLVWPDGSREPVMLAGSGRPHLTVSADAAWVSTFGETGRELRYFDTADGTLRWTTDASDVLEHRGLGEGIVAKVPEGFRFIDEDGIESDVVGSATMELVASSPARPYAVLVEPESFTYSLLGPNGSLTPLPAFEGMVNRFGSLLTDRRAFVVWRSPTGTGDDLGMIDLDDGAWRGWDFGVDDQPLAAWGLDAEPVALLLFSDAAVIYRVDARDPIVAPPVELEFARPAFIFDRDERFALATHLDTSDVIVVELASGLIASTLVAGVPLGWIEVAG